MSCSGLRVGKAVHDPTGESVRDITEDGASEAEPQQQRRIRAIHPLEKPDCRSKKGKNAPESPKHRADTVQPETPVHWVTRI